MDWKDIDRARIQGFPLVRRGYDKREVDKFVLALQDWLENDAANELGDQSVQRKLDLVGKTTSQVLLTAEKEAELMRRQTRDESAQLRSETEAASLETRRASDEYAKKVREKADQDARRLGEESAAKARRTIEEGERRRAQIEEVIAGLDARREGTLQDMERLQGELAATIGKHKAGARPAGRRNGVKDEAKAAKTADAVAET